MKLMSKNRTLRIVLVFIWVGFVCAISFMEAWLKFEAPNVTLPIGLGIGRLVFGALNKVELFAAAGILATLISAGLLKSKTGGWLLLPLLILLLQTFWLLPQLDLRAELIINDIEPKPSSLHLSYVVCEAVKIISLTIYGIKQFYKYE